MSRTLRWPALGVAFALALGVNTAEAQVNATVVLKSGQRHTGHNVRYRVDRREVAVRTTLHEEPRLNVDQVAYIDFGGTAATPVALSGSQEAVVLRDGNVIKGQVIELDHIKPGDESSDYLVIVRAESGEEKRLPASQVARVYFRGGATAVATSGSQQSGATGAGLVVPAQQKWTPTGITVRKGETITLNTTGEVQLSSDPGDVATPTGAKSQRYANGAALPRVLAGALIGRIGPNGQPFGIGNQTSVPMPESGQLFLGINDDDVNDNRGEFRVEIVQRPAGRIRR